jgi:hypothetical protein
LGIPGVTPHSVGQQRSVGVRAGFVSGILAGALVSLLLEAARAIGVPIRLEWMLGTLFGFPPGPAAFVGGYTVHLILSGATAVLYNCGFRRAPRRTAVAMGLAFSLIHLAIVGVAAAAVPPMHLHPSEVLPRPGPFFSNFGTLGIVTLVLAHLAYGAIVGAVHDAMRFSATALVPSRRRRHRG